MTEQPIKVLVVDDDEKARDGLIEQLRFQDVEVVGESILGAAAFTWAQQLAVDVVVVAIEEPVARALRTVESLSVGSRSWPVIGLSSLGDRETMRKAMVAGVRDFLVAPVDSGELHRAIVNIHRVEFGRRVSLHQGNTANHLGTIVTVTGVKGGVGKSFVATNVAVALAQLTKQHVAMLDLDLQFGDAAVLLDVVPQYTVEHAVKEIGRLDPQLCSGYLTDHPSRVKLLAAPASPDTADEVTSEHVGQIVEALASTSDYLVVDTSGKLDHISVVPMDLSTLVLLVVVPEVPCIRRTKACLTLMQEWDYSRDKVKLVVNRTRRKSEVTIPEIEEVLGYPVFAQIPEDRAAGRAISLGTPVAMSAPRSRSGKAANELGRVLAGLPEPPGRFAFLRRRKPAKVQPSSRLIAPPVSQPQPAPAEPPTAAYAQPAPAPAAPSTNGSTAVGQSPRTSSASGGAPGPAATSALPSGWAAWGTRAPAATGLIGRSPYDHEESNGLAEEPPAALVVAAGGSEPGS